MTDYVEQIGKTAHSNIHYGRNPIEFSHMDKLLLSNLMFHIQSLRVDVNDLGYHMSNVSDMSEPLLERLESINSSISLLNTTVTNLAQRYNELSLYSGENFDIPCTYTF